jgi:serine/threonine-protein kinase
VVSRVGQLIDGRYEVVSILGSGSMSTVWMALHNHTGRRVAVKVMERSVGGAHASWLNELRATAKADSAHSAEIIDGGSLPCGRFFLTMELVEGQSLEDILHAYRLHRSPLPYRSAVHIGAQICSALACAHRLGVVHQDLKPSNVIIMERSDDPEFVKVLDFGVASICGGRKERSGAAEPYAVGTAAYMAPEQLRLDSNVDARADLYALGVMLFEALTAELPFSGASPEQMAQARLERLPRPCAQLRPDLPPALCRLVDSLLHPDPSRRPESADAVRAALNAILIRPPTSILDFRHGLPKPERPRSFWGRLLGLAGS